MSETPPGRAAYDIPDVYARYIRATFPPEVLVNAPNEITGRWKHMTGLAEREFWRSLDVGPAPELAAAVAETRQLREQLIAAHAETRHFLAQADQLRDLTAEILAAFGPSASDVTPYDQWAMVTQDQFDGWTKRAGLAEGSGT